MLQELLDGSALHGGGTVRRAVRELGGMCRCRTLDADATRVDGHASWARRGPRRRLAAWRRALAGRAAAGDSTGTELPPACASARASGCSSGSAASASPPAAIIASATALAPEPTMSTGRARSQQRHPLAWRPGLASRPAAGRQRAGHTPCRGGHRRPPPAAVRGGSLQRLDACSAMTARLVAPTTGSRPPAPARAPPRHRPHAREAAGADA